MKFKVGDRVKLKDDLIIGNRYGKGPCGISFNEQMAELINEVLTIKAVYNDDTCLVNESSMYFDEEMFEPYPEETHQSEKKDNSHSFEKMFSNFGKMFDNPQVLSVSFGKVINQKDEKIQKLQDKIKELEQEIVKRNIAIARVQGKLDAYETIVNNILQDADKESEDI